MCEHGTSPPQSQSVVSAHRDTYREKLKTKSREELQKMLEAERPGSTRTGPYGVYDDVDVGENVKDIERQLGLKAPSGELVSEAAQSSVPDVQSTTGIETAGKRTVTGSHATGI